jgi:nucleotide-binding universal stress UspA family protein
MYKRILVPLDGSKLAEKTLKFTTELIKRMSGVEVVLMCVCSPQEGSMKPMHKAYIQQVAETTRKCLEQTVSVQVKSKLATGYPADEILRYSQAHKIDLIIMTTHGRSGINRWAMGSTAYKVMRSEIVPVFLISANMDDQTILEKANSRTILVPLDSEEISEAVLPYVEKLVQQIGVEELEVMLLSVCEKPQISSDYPYDMPLSWEEHVEKERLMCKLTSGLYLANVSKQLEDAGLKVQSEVSLGKTGHEIIKYAKEINAGFIAMSTHGRSGLSRWVYGSVAEQVMLGALTPVMMVRQTNHIV